MNRTGSYANGFAPRDGMPAYPSLWNGRRVSIAPCLGPTGIVMRDWSSQKANATIVGTAVGSAWSVDSGKYAYTKAGTGGHWLAQTAMVQHNKAEETISCWVKFNNAASERTFVSIGQGASSFGNYTILRRLSGTNTLQLAVWNGSAYTTTAISDVLFDNVWYHIAYVHSVAASRSDLYINGVKYSGGTLYQDASTDHSYVYWGSNSNSGVTGLDGCMDDMCICGPMTDNQIQVLASRRGIAYDMAQPIWYADQGGFNAAWALRQKMIIGSGGGLG